MILVLGEFARRGTLSVKILLLATEALNVKPLAYLGVYGLMSCFLHLYLDTLFVFLFPQQGMSE